MTRLSLLREGVERTSPLQGSPRAPPPPSPALKVAGETWKNLVDTLHLEPHELACYLARDHKPVSLREESAIPNNHLDLEHSVTTATIMTTMGAHPRTKYFLMVVAGKVQVLFGLAQCFALVQTGGQYYALMGDYKKVHPGAPIKPPDLPGNIPEQAPTFERVMVHLQGIKAITTLLMAGTGWVAPNPSVQAFLTFHALPVHPKMAALFFWGVPVDMAYLWVCLLLVPFSAETLELHMPLFQFLTAVVTQEGDNHGVSCIQTNWKHKDLGATEELQEWYFELLVQRARLPSQPEPIAVALPAAPMGTLPISPDSVIQLANLLGVHYHPPAPTKMVPATPAEKYNQYKIIILAGLCSLQGHPKTWCDLQVEALPDFWVQILRSM
jgi:hypothetical protein